MTTKIVKTTPVKTSIVKTAVATVKAKPAIAKSVKPVAAKPVASRVAATKPVAKVVVAPVKVKKHKLVRDSFTMPKDEYVVIETLKLRAGKLGQSPKKSELLRAGIKALATLSDIQFKAALSNVPTIKTGRPKDVK